MWVPTAYTLGVEATNHHQGETEISTFNAAGDRIAFRSENARLLEKLSEKGVEVRDFDGWKAVGKWVRKGEKQKSFRVQSGVRSVGIDPITGDDRYEPNFKTAYGFTADQVK